jgi:RimJ/RimL family protein N-acetyltransferase
MHDRCSEETRYQRYFAPVSQWREDRLRKIAGGHRGATLVAETEDGSLVGLGNVFPEKPEGAATAEVAVIIEDAWQGQGVGSVVLRRLIELAERWDFDEITALVLATNTVMITVLENTGLAWVRDADPDLPGSVVRMTAPLPR